MTIIESNSPLTPNNKNVGSQIKFKSSNISSLNKKRIDQIKKLGVKEPFNYLGVLRATNIIPDLYLESDSKYEEIVIIIESNNKKYYLMSSYKILEGLFIYHKHNCNSVANTHKQTELKERISMLLCEFPFLKESDVIDFIKKNYPELIELYKTIYYESGIKHSELFREFVGGKSFYEYELQNGKYSKILYNKVKSLVKIHKDNWNPGDIWVFSVDGVKKLESVENINSINELNEFMRENLNSKDIIPISLKQIEKEGKVVIVDYKKREKINLDFNIKKINIPKSLKSIHFITNSGFTLKGNMRGSSNSLNLNFETTFVGNNYSEGAVPSDLFHNRKKESKREIFNGINTPLMEWSDLILSYESLINIKKYININLDLSLEELRCLSIQDKKRFIIIISHLLYICNDKMVFDFSYYAGMKMNEYSSPYLKLSM